MNEMKSFSRSLSDNFLNNTQEITVDKLKFHLENQEEQTQPNQLSYVEA